jgi:hypothetical protein
MKRLLLGVLAIMMLVVTGCGRETIAVNPPTITTYQFTKDAVNEFIDGSVGFYAPDSDIDSMTVAVFDSRGYEIARTKTFLSLRGVTHGTIFFSIDYITYPADRFTFSIYLTDFNGYTSNQAVDTFLVP